MNEANTASPITNIAKGTHITADIETSSIIQVSGRIEGDITTKSHLVLEESGHITGTVVCKKATVSGKLTGELRATEHLDIRSSAKLDGFVFTKKIMAEEGSVIIGIVKAGPNVDVLNSKISGQGSSQGKHKPHQPDPGTAESKSDSSEKPVAKDTTDDKPLNRFLHKLLIGIPEVKASNEQTGAIYNASEEFLQALDFNLEIFDEPSYAPFYQSLTFVRKGPEEQDEVEKDFENGKKVIETAFLKKEAEEDASKLQRSAIRLTNLIGKFEDIALLLGEVLIIKFQQNEVQTIAIETISEQVMEKLRKDPKQITDPEKLYSLL
ncbi:bactofilin family protein [Gracilimonas halophila]|uniref:Polymer-forming cytoskeletal protein n=1 Tax=Gracilimonas halophila TaxID=1834464 RepID=A0ABW5JIF3_9BACT